MVVELLLYFADRGGYERSCARVTDGGDDPGRGLVAGLVGSGAVGDGADGKPLCAWGVHPDEGASCGGQAGVHPVAPGAVFGDCEVLPRGWERIFGGHSSGRGERGSAEEAGAGECFRSADGAGNGAAERGCCDACETPGWAEAASERAERDT